MVTFFIVCGTNVPVKIKHLLYNVYTFKANDKKNDSNKKVVNKEIVQPSAILAIWNEVVLCCYVLCHDLEILLFQNKLSLQIREEHDLL